MLKTYTLPYHNASIELKIPDRNVLNYVALRTENNTLDNITHLRQAMANTHGTPLRLLVDRKKVALIVEDATRAVPLDDLLQELFPHLSGARAIVVLLATGTHDGENEENHKIISKVKYYAAHYSLPVKEIVNHNCHSHEFYSAGITQGIKNEVFVNTKVRDAQVFVTLSDMKNHYFAGYSNAHKNFLPGICKYETIERNHALALKEQATFGHHPLHPDPSRRNNPLSQDIGEGYRLIVGRRPVYVLATITKQNQILWAGAGELEEVVSQGIEKVDEMMSVVVTPSDKMIVSCGGYPGDESLYTAQRALELTKNGIKNSGEILFLAGCANGIGPQKSIGNFYEPLKKDISDILGSYQKQYIMYSHKTYKFAQLIQKMKQIHMVSLLPLSSVADIHLNPVTDAQTVVDGWLKKNPDTVINIFSEGNKIAVHAKP
jgi:nickel-dependent lactate racemase